MPPHNESDDEFNTQFEPSSSLAPEDPYQEDNAPKLHRAEVSNLVSDLVVDLQSRSVRAISFPINPDLRRIAELHARKPRVNYSTELASGLTDIAIAAYAEGKTHRHAVTKHGQHHYRLLSFHVRVWVEYPLIMLH